MPPLSAWTTSIPALAGASRRSVHSSSVKSALLVICSSPLSMDGGVASHGRALGSGTLPRPSGTWVLGRASVPAAARAAAGVGDGEDEHDCDGEHDRSRDPGPPAWFEKRVHGITSYQGYGRARRRVQTVWRRSRGVTILAPAGADGSWGEASGFVALGIPSRPVRGRLDECRRPATYGVAEAVLEAVDAAVAIAGLGAGLLLRVALAVVPLRPRGVRFRQPARAPQGEGIEQQAEHSVQEAELRERDEDRADVDQEQDDPRNDDAGRGCVEARREGAGQHQGDEHDRDDRRVHRLASLVRPVDVLEVDPEGELVEGEPGADPEHRRGDLDPRRLRLVEREAQRAADQHQHDAEDEVVDVKPALGLNAAGPPRHLGTPHEAGARADEEERDEKRREQDQDARAHRFTPAAEPEVDRHRADLATAAAQPLEQGS